MSFHYIYFKLYRNFSFIANIEWFNLWYFEHKFVAADKENH